MDGTPKQVLKWRQRNLIECLVKNKKTLQETVDFLKVAFGEDVLSYVTIWRWYRDFSEGRREDITDSPREGRPTSQRSQANIDAVNELIQEDRHITVREISSLLDISTGTVHTIITKDLNKRYVSSKWVPRFLTIEQKQARLDASMEFLENFEEYGEDWLFSIVTEDETWIYNFEPKSKKDTMGWYHKDSPQQRKAKFLRTTTKKTMFLIFFDSSGVLVQHAVEAGSTVTGQYFANVSMSKSKYKKVLVVFHL